MSVCLWARQLCGRGLVSGCCCCSCWCKVPAKAWALGVAVCTCRLLFAPGQGQKHNKLRENALRCNGLWGGGRGGVRCGECGKACGRSTLENLLFMNAVPPPPLPRCRPQPIKIAHNLKSRQRRRRRRRRRHLAKKNVKNKWRNGTENVT